MILLKPHIANNKKVFFIDANIYQVGLYYKRGDFEDGELRFWTGLFLETKTSHVENVENYGDFSYSLSRED